MKTSMINMRVHAAAVALFLSCQSGVSVETGGALQFPCTREKAGDPKSGNCPGDLFCGADGRCHAADAGGDYACLDDGDCGGGFRCGPIGTCVDPSADALRSGAPDVVLDAGRVIASGPAWGDITALAVGRTYYERYGSGPAVDVTPVAFSD